jgi:zinc protease
MLDKLPVVIKGLFTLACVILATTANATPDIQTWKTSTGAKVMFVAAGEIPMLDVRVVFDGGSARDNGNYGLAVLTNGLLSEGADGMNAQEVAARFESVGAQIDYDALKDMAIIGVRSLTESKYLKPALTTLQQVLVKPDFPQKAFDRELNRMKVALKAKQQSPAALAADAFNLAVFGDHPYAFPSDGTKDSLNRLTREDVLEFYKQFYVAKNATVAIVGNVDRKQAESIAEKLMSGLPAGEAAPALPPVAQLKESKTVTIDFPSTQTHIFVGQPGVKRGDKDYFDLYVANHTFGGSGFASRLVEDIREKHGLAYSVYSYFTPMRQDGAFTMGMQTRTDQTQQALKMLRDQLKKFVAKGPTSEELKDSVSNIKGGFPLKFDSNGKLLEYISMIGFYDLPIAYLDDFIKRIDQVSLKTIDDALKRRLHPDRMVTVIVGKQGQG